MQKILLVDDDLLTLQTIGKMLEYFNHQVSAVNNADDALALVREQHFDVAVVDLVLKGRSGLELTRIIRTERPSLPVIVISGYVNPQSSAAFEALNDLGVAHILTKPIAPGDLEAAIEAVTGGKHR